MLPNCRKKYSRYVVQKRPFLGLHDADLVALQSEVKLSSSRKISTGRDDTKSVSIQPRCSVNWRFHPVRKAEKKPDLHFGRCIRSHPWTPPLECVRPFLSDLQSYLGYEKPAATTGQRDIKGKVNWWQRNGEPRSGSKHLWFQAHRVWLWPECGNFLIKTRHACRKVIPLYRIMNPPDFMAQASLNLIKWKQDTEVLGRRSGRGRHWVSSWGENSAIQ